MLGVLCIIGCPVQFIKGCVVVVETHWPLFEALAYVLPHFDELTHVLRLSFKGLLRSDIEVDHCRKYHNIP